jgi:DNA end-binding protein Ku
MVYADEVNDPAEVSELSSLGEVDISERELTMARQLIDSLDAAFKPAEYHDTYREKVLDLIEAKASGSTEVLEAPPAEAEGQKVVDLMAALEQSVKDAKSSRSRHPTARKAAGAKKASKAAKKKAAS